MLKVCCVCKSMNHFTLSHSRVSRCLFHHKIPLYRDLQLQMISMKLEQRYSYKKMSTKTKQKMLVIVILQKQLISFQQNEYLWFSYLLHAAFCAYGMNCLVWKHQKCFRDQHTNHNDNCSSISKRSSEDYVVNVLPTHWPQNRIRELESLGILRDDQSVHE